MTYILLHIFLCLTPFFTAFYQLYTRVHPYSPVNPQPCFTAQFLDFLIFRPEYLDYRPSVLAATVFSKITEDEDMVEFVSGYSVEDLSEVRSWLLLLLLTFRLSRAAW